VHYNTYILGYMKLIITYILGYIKCVITHTYRGTLSAL